MYKHISPEAKQCTAANIINPAAGFDAIPMTVIEEKHFSAGEVGEMLEVSANKIGRVANANNLKTEEFGKFFLVKLARSSKQVEAFRYRQYAVILRRQKDFGKLAQIEAKRLSEDWAG